MRRRGRSRGETTTTMKRSLRGEGPSRRPRMSLGHATTLNPWETIIPSWEFFSRFFPKFKEVLKATSTNYLACLLQVHLFGLCDILGGVEIRETDGTIFDSNIGDPSRKDWFNKHTRRIYISYCLTESTAMAQPCDFQLPPMLRDAINVNLLPGAPKPVGCTS
jgi:hypothetical protein